MREVKFRGVSKKTGKFVFGWLQDNFIHTSISNEFEWLGEEIIDGTEGQFTGLKDCNGKKIFEGDIVKYDNGDIANVIFKGCCFQAYNGNASNSEDAYLSLESEFDIFTMQSNFTIQIIGNIHENQDLIQ